MAAIFQGKSVIPIAATLRAGLIQVLGPHKTMQLIEVLSNLDALPDDAFVCARKPWAPNSEIKLVTYQNDLQVPDSVKAQGFEYFLEVETIREILEGFLPYSPSLKQIVDFVLYYAEYDAFPGWANELCKH